MNTGDVMCVWCGYRLKRFGCEACQRFPAVGYRIDATTGKAQPTIRHLVTGDIWTVDINPDTGKHTYWGVTTSVDPLSLPQTYTLEDLKQTPGVQKSKLPGQKNTLMNYFAS